MAPVSFSSAPSVVGLDVGSDHVRAAHLQPSSSGFTLTGYGRVNIPLGAVVEGEIVDTDAVASAIRELWKRAGIRSKDVAVGVSNQKVVVRLVDLPYMEQTELENAIQYQAQDYIPIPVDDAILDFQILGDYMTPADEHMMEVLLVAAQRDMIEAAVRSVESAGLRLAGIDVTAFALVRGLFGPVPSVLPEEGEAGEAVGVIHISSGITNIAVVEKGVPRFTRVSSLAGNQFTQSIANVLNVTFDEAEELKIRIGLPSMDVEGGAGMLGGDPQVTQAVQQALEREANKFIAEVRRSLDYYLTQTTQVRTIRRIYMTGSGSQLRNLSAYLERGLQAQVVLADPLSRVQAANATVEQAVLADRMGCTAAIGLAMGGVA